MRDLFFIKCAYCGRDKAVRGAWLAKKQRFCSLSCFGKVNHPKQGPNVMTCQQCGTHKVVRDAYTARIRRFCSKRCQAKSIPPAQRRLRGQKAGATSRQRMLARFGSDEQRRAWYGGYNTGWKAGIRYMQRWGSGSPAQG